MAARTTSISRGKTCRSKPPKATKAPKANSRYVIVASTASASSTASFPFQPVSRPSLSLVFSRQRTRLAKHVEKALLEFIEEYGGLHSNTSGNLHKFFEFSEEKLPLSALCDEHPHLFGNANTPLRDKIRKRVETLKKRKTREKYLELLIFHKITPYAKRTNPKTFERTQVAAAVPISFQGNTTLPRANVVEAVHEEEQQQQKSPPKSPPKVIKTTNLPPLVSPLAHSARRSATPTTMDDQCEYSV